MSHDLPKAYDPGSIEPRWAEAWVREGLFTVPTPPEGAPLGPIFTILLPPPNVTGRMHMGHMLEHTETDIYVRWQRMRGRMALWLPGTDHAGIATQMLVERSLADTDRRELGRKKFLERVWQWREHYGGEIVRQMKRLGDSVDWSREYFTMDEPRSRAVRECFVRLWEDGLIYRGNYIVNWCPGCGTAISDLEVVHEELIGKLYEIKYPVDHPSEPKPGSPEAPGEGSSAFITVATTRPETMLGDTAVAVNRADKRYLHLHGKRVRLPLAPERRVDAAGNAIGPVIPIIEDEVANPEFGTGAVKVTPAHDPNDFLAGQRQNLPQVTVMDEHARMNQNAGPYAGLDRFAARERIVEVLRAQGLLAAVRDHPMALGRCQRCSSVVEPRLSTQWFLAVNQTPKRGGASLAGRAREVVESGEVTFTPEMYKAIYLNWMENIHDWCISRQLWWGHRIPAWHCRRCDEIAVAREAPAKCAQCGETAGGALEQDPDVLDTWFSSGLLPFTAFGWPEKTRDLDVFYPTTLMITGFDILFFWVARMIMLGCYFMAGHRQLPEAKEKSGFGERRADDVPFRDVYIHALVRDAERQKMSKTKGNVVDPIEITERMGTDAVRFALAVKAAPGTDISFDEKQVESYRAFANKIWNASRFVFMNVDRAQAAGVWSLADFARQSPNGQETRFEPAALEDRWIISRFTRATQQINDSLAAYRFHEAAQTAYQFFWDEFCDWYLELVKLRLNFDDAAQRAPARAALSNLVTLLEAALRMLSPFMPFLTEEIWHAVYEGKPPRKSVALAAYPEPEAQYMDAAAETEMAIVQDLIVSVRNLRAELKVEARQRTPVRVFAEAAVRRLVEQNRIAVERLANVDQIEFAPASLAGVGGSRSTSRFDVALVYEKKVDSSVERDRLQKDLARLEAEMASAQSQLSNEQFLSRAPENVIAGRRARAAELNVLLEKTRRALEELGR